MRVFSSLDEVAAAAQTEIGTSDWFEIEQERVNLFADATDDHQWIHVDVEQGERGPVRRPDRARLPHPVAAAVPRQPGHRVRDPRRPPQLRRSTRSASPTRSASAAGSACTPRSARSPTCPTGKQVVLGYTIEIEGQAKPACVAEMVVLLLA